MATKQKEPTTTYEVVNTPLLHDGDLYQPGDPVELTERQAKRQAGNVTKVEDGKPSA